MNRPKKKHPKKWKDSDKLSAIQNSIHLNVALGFQNYYADAGAVENIFKHLLRAEQMLKLAIDSFKQVAQIQKTKKAENVVGGLNV